MVLPSAEREAPITAIRDRASKINSLEKPFPGVPILGIRVGLEHEVTDYDSELLPLLYSIADRLDTPIEDNRTWLEYLVPGVFSRELFSREVVVEQQKNILPRLKH